jgi:lipopolysaccharide biosynthesis protein
METAVDSSRMISDMARLMTKATKGQIIKDLYLFEITGVNVWIFKAVVMATGYENPLSSVNETRRNSLTCWARMKMVKSFRPPQAIGLEWNRFVTLEMKYGASCWIRPKLDVQKTSRSWSKPTFTYWNTLST